MNRAQSYAQIPISESPDANDSESSTTNPRAKSSNSHGKGVFRGKGSSRGYAALNSNDHEDEDEDQFEDAQEDSVMLRPMNSSFAPSSSAVAASSSASAPRRPVYPSGHDSDNEISVAPSSLDNEASSSSGNDASGRQRPDRDARRFVQSTMDGVFSNLSAKPRVEKPYEEELPPSYKSAAMDVSPAYYESLVSASGYLDDDEALVDGLPVGGILGFMWNVIISMSFQFVGFFLTYLLHTSHSTKEGSKTGLGITFISMGFRMLTGKPILTSSGSAASETEGYDENDDPIIADLDTGYMGNTGATSPYPYSALGSEYVWLSYFLCLLGGFIVVQSLFQFARAKRAEMVMNATSTAEQEASVPAAVAAGTSDSAVTGAVTTGSSSGSGLRTDTHSLVILGMPQ
ncbi:Nedd4 interacting protein [Mortierella alpina]|uniref:Nedd4 interacting protein n=1 Tax=Mortierella alpina TaxID=64518 RepID=A0A9P6M2Q3_MORAP|nr:Nedd4 interacting protein [Mortierella alpina]